MSISPLGPAICFSGCVVQAVCAACAGLMWLVDEVLEVAEHGIYSSRPVSGHAGHRSFPVPHLCIGGSQLGSASDRWRGPGCGLPSCALQCFASLSRVIPPAREVAQSLLLCTAGVAVALLWLVPHDKTYRSCLLLRFPPASEASHFPGTSTAPLATVGWLSVVLS